MEFLGLDFETYYDEEYSLSKMTTAQYVLDPRFETIGVGLIYRSKRYWMEDYQFRAFAKQADWSRIGVLAHHAHFDGLILSHHYNARPGYWLDTLSMARAIHGTEVGGSLSKLMSFYGVGRKLVELAIVARGKHRCDFTPEQWAHYGTYCVNDNEGALALFHKMLPGFPPSELDLIDTTVRMFTEPVLVLDQQMMTEVLTEEIKRKDKLLAEAGVEIKQLSSNEKFATILRSLDVEPPMKESDTQRDENNKPVMIYAFAKTDPGMQELLEHPDDDVRIMAEARVAVKSTINESRSARLLNLGFGGRSMPVYLKYSGAHTYRWSGGDKVNWQNFERTNKKDPNKGRIRKAIRAPSGMKIVKADASQIEARFNAWAAGEDMLVEQFRNGEDVYSLFASDVYGRKVDRKNNPEDELPGFVGKTCILGLGYRMGWFKLALEMLIGRGGAPKVQFTRDYLDRFGIDPSPFLANPRIVQQIKDMPSRLPEAERMIHCCVTNYLVNTYRGKYQRISNNWEYWDRVIQWMFSGENYGPVGVRGVLRLEDEALVMPNGFKLRYSHLEHSRETGFTFLSKRGGRNKLHGGIMVENYTQALCRMIIGDAINRLTWGRARAGLEPYKVAQTEHDAITCVVEERRAGECLNDLMRAITTPPSWAPGLPLAAEGGIYDTMGG